MRFFTAKQDGQQGPRHRDTTRFAILLLALCPVLSALSKTHVPLIMADDLRDFGGAFTKEVVKTPNLDRLRARGTTFERAYGQYPVCNPSRSSMMAGLRAEQTASWAITFACVKKCRSW